MDCERIALERSFFEFSVFLCNTDRINPTQVCQLNWQFFYAGNFNNILQYLGQKTHLNFGNSEDKRSK